MSDKALIQYSAKLAMESNETFKCAVCHDRLSKPIRYCKVGHLYCEKCKAKLNDCAICHQDFSEDINVTMEHILENSTFPCQNEMFGCKMVAKYAEINKHEDMYCDFKKVQCCLNVDITNNPCNETFKLHDFEAHIRNDHLCREKTFFDKELRRDILIDSNQNQFRRVEIIEVLQEEDKYNNSTFFLEKIWYNNQNKTIVISYHHVGLVKDAEKYQYFIMLQDDKNPALITTHQNQCLQIGLSDENIKNSGKSLIMSLRTYMNVNERRKLLNITLKLDFTEKEKRLRFKSQTFKKQFSTNAIGITSVSKPNSKSLLNEGEKEEKFNDTTAITEEKEKLPLKIEELSETKSEDTIGLNGKPIADDENVDEITKETHPVIVCIQKWSSIILFCFAFLIEVFIYHYFMN